MGLVPAVLTLACAAALAGACGPAGESSPEEEVVMEKTLKVQSAAFADGAAIPVKHTGDGDDVSPALSWAAGPEGTVSYAVVVDDPDAPGGTWVHWVIWNLADTKLPERVPPAATGPGGSVQGKNSWRRAGYGGPKPPSGTHRYFFKVYALDEPLALGADARKEELLRAMKGHTLAYGELMGTYTHVR